MNNQPIALALLGICLLPSCASLPAPVQMMFQPAEQVRHSRGDVASGYYRLGRYHQDHGDLALALAAYTYAIARDPQGAEGRMAAAVIHAQQGRLPQARAMLLAVCAEYPHLVQPRNNLGYVYYLQGEYVAAADAFHEVLGMDPANVRARNNLMLAKAAGTGRIAATAAIEPTPVVPPLAPALAATMTPPAPPAMSAGAMQLVQLAPNLYELKIAKVEPMPVPPVPTAVTDILAGRETASRLEIANGNGTTGMASRFRKALAARGFADVRLTNAKPFGRAQTSIEFRPGFEPLARALQATLGGKAALRPADKREARADLRLVLGMDADLAFERAPGATGGAMLTSAGSSDSIDH